MSEESNHLFENGRKENVVGASEFSRTMVQWSLIWVVFNAMILKQNRSVFWCGETQDTGWLQSHNRTLFFRGKSFFKIKAQQRAVRLNNVTPHNFRSRTCLCTVPCVFATYRQFRFLQLAVLSLKTQKPHCKFNFRKNPKSQFLTLNFPARSNTLKRLNRRFLDKIKVFFMICCALPVLILDLCGRHAFLQWFSK